MIDRIRRWLQPPKPEQPAPAQPSPFILRMRDARREGLAEKRASQRAVQRIQVDGLYTRATVGPVRKDVP